MQFLQAIEFDSKVIEPNNFKFTTALADSSCSNFSTTAFHHALLTHWFHETHKERRKNKIVHQICSCGYCSMLIIQFCIRLCRNV